METKQQTFERLVKTSQKFAPKFRVVSKADHWLHKAIGWVLRTFKLNQSYMTDYWTTLGATTAYPLEETPGEHFNSWKVVPHEGLHAQQARKISNFLFAALYLLGTPVYAVLLLACWPFFVWLPWWSGLIYIGAVALLCSPIPSSWFRYKWERDAYFLSIAIDYWTNGSVSDQQLERIADQFVTSQYFWMWPYGRKSLMKKLRQARALAESGEVLSDPFYRAVWEALKESGRVRGDQ